MADWPSYTVAELQDAGVLRVEDGNHGEYRPRPAEFVDHGTAFIRAADLTDGQVRFQHAGAISETALRRIRKGVGQPGDILFSHKGTVGKLARVPMDAPPFVCSPQTTFWRVLDERQLRRDYLYAYMRSPAFVSQWWVRKGETDMADYVSLTAQRQLRVAVPTAEVQRRIAEPLAAIDDLIENNRRRVELVEQMIHAIYREWFVRFRFPGYDGAGLVDSALGWLPVGWDCLRLSEIATVVRGRSYRKHELVDQGGSPFINLKCMARGGGFRRSGLKRYTGKHDPEQRVRGGDIVLAVTDLTQEREILARATLVPDLGNEVGVISLDVVRIVPLNDADRLPLLYALGCTDFAHRVKELANGSTVLHLAPSHVAEALVAWPPKVLRTAFDDVVRPMVSQITAIESSIERLTSMRDLLLPKLVTGQIDVSTIELDVILSEVEGDASGGV